MWLFRSLLVPSISVVCLCACHQRRLVAQAPIWLLQSAAARRGVLRACERDSWMVVSVRCRASHTETLDHGAPLAFQVLLHSAASPRGKRRSGSNAALPVADRASPRRKKPAKSAPFC